MFSARPAMLGRLDRKLSEALQAQMVQRVSRAIKVRLDRMDHRAKTGLQVQQVLRVKLDHRVPLGQGAIRALRVLRANKARQAAQVLMGRPESKGPRARTDLWATLVQQVLRARLEVRVPREKWAPRERPETRAIRDQQV